MSDTPLTDQPSSAFRPQRGPDRPGSHTPLHWKRSTWHNLDTGGSGQLCWRSPPRAPWSPASSSASARRRPRPPARATSTPPAARPASPRTAPPGRCTARTTARSTRSGAPRTTPPATSACSARAAYANAAAQDSFCASTTCVITIIYDQSGRNNRLTQAPPGGFRGPAAGGYDNLANATAAPITVGGHKAYGVFVAPGTGYRNNNTNGVATGDQPEGMYAIFDGTHYNGGCCFDYGNAETQQPRQRQRHHGGHLLRQHQGLGLRRRQRPLDHGRPGERPVLRGERSATTPTTRPSTTGS